MKKLTFTILVSFVLFVLGGCSNHSSDNADKDKLHIFVSFYPYYEIASTIGGNHVIVESMIPNNTEAHDYEPTLKQIVSLQKSDVFLYNGLHFEEWAEKATTELPKDVTVIEAASLVPKIEFHDSDHVDEDTTSEHSHGEYDPHVWLNPQNMIAISTKVRDTLVQLDPKNKESYETNYEYYKKTLEDLDKEFETALAPVKNKKFIVSHAAFGHLANRYHLEQEGVSGLSPHSEPSAKKIVELQQLIKQENITHIYMETLASPKTTEMLAKDVGITVLPLNPIEGLTNDEIQTKESYVTVMKKNLQNLLIGFGIQ